MTIENMHIWFDILQDKYNTPYFTETERDHFINDAALDFVLEFIVEGKDGAIKLEETVYSNSALSLVTESKTVPTSAAGLLTTAVIENAIGGEVIVILSITPQTGDTNTSKFIRAMELDIELNNPLSNLAKSTPGSGYVFNSTGIQMHPAATFNVQNVTMVAIRIPTAANHSGSTDLVDLPDFTHRKIVAKALVKTGMVTEDQAISIMDSVTAG